MAQLVEDFCIEHLRSASLPFLTNLATEYQIPIPVDKANSKSYVSKLVLRYLTSETVEKSADNGAAIFLKLELGTELRNERFQYRKLDQSAVLTF